MGRVRLWLTASLVLLLCALALAVVATGPGTVSGDIAIARAVQRPASGTIDAVAQIFSLIGANYPSTVILGVIGVGLLILVGRRDLALFLGIAAGLRAIGPVLKVLIASPRPTAEAVAIVAKADGLGFPRAATRWERRFSTVLSRSLRRKPSLESTCRPRHAGHCHRHDGSHRALTGAPRGGIGRRDVAGGLLFGLAAVCLMQAVWLAGGRRRSEVSDPCLRRASWRV